MQKYIGTTIPVSDHHGIVLKNDKDIIAYDDEKYIYRPELELDGKKGTI